MKFKLKDGTIYEDIRDVVNNFCQQREDSKLWSNICVNCPIDIQHQNCIDFARDNPKQTAILIGAEIIPDEEEPKKTHKEYKIQWNVDGKWTYPVYDMICPGSDIETINHTFENYSDALLWFDMYKEYISKIQKNPRLRIISHQVTGWEVEKEC